jgi:small subunit ribosomal protein S6
VLRTEISQKEEHTTMALYEVTVIARQDLSQAQASSLADEVSGIAENNGAQVSKKEYWGLRPFTFRIRKNRKGHYLYQEMTSGAAAVAELDRLLKLHENILRHLIVRVEAFCDGPTIMLTAKPEREGRDGPGGPRGDRGDRPDRSGPRRPRDEGYRPRREAGAEDTEDAAVSA